MSFRVIDLSVNSLAAAHATAIVGASGVDVVKVEWERSGDPLRGRSPLISNATNGHGTSVSAPFIWTSSDKRWVAVDGLAIDRQEVISRLAQSCSVSILSSETPEAIRTLVADVRLPAVYITPFGLDGPRSPWQASSTGLFHVAGPGYVTPRAPQEGRERLVEPQAPWGNVAEYFGGTYGAVALLAYSIGDGPPVTDLSLQECLVPLVRREMAAYHYNGYVASRQERLWRVAPSGFYTTRDGVVYVSVVEDKQWVRLCQLIGREELAHDSRFSTAETRFQNLEGLDAILRPWFANRGNAWLFAACGERGIPAGPASNPIELLASPHLLERGFFSEVLGDRLPSYPVVRIAPKPQRIGSRGGLAKPPNVGMDTRDVLRGIGFSAGEVRELADRGVILG